MIQFYFLSVLANILGGLILAGEYLDEKIPSFSAVKVFFDSKPGFRVTIGFVASIVGILKLLSVTAGDIPFVGDFLPALVGLLIGASIFLERYKERSAVSSNVVETGDKLLLKNRSIIGIVGIVTGLLHFLLPKVLFL